MKIILHAQDNCELRDQLKLQIESVFSESQIILTTAIQQLSDALCRPLHNISVVIALIIDAQSPRLLSPLMPLFENIKLILLFRERSDGAWKAALHLEPLCTGFSGDGFQDVISVLKRIEEKRMLSANRF